MYLCIFQWPNVEFISLWWFMRFHILHIWILYTQEYLRHHFTTLCILHWQSGRITPNILLFILWVRRQKKLKITDIKQWFSYNSAQTHWGWLTSNDAHYRLARRTHLDSFIFSNWRTFRLLVMNFNLLTNNETSNKLCQFLLFPKVLLKHY